MDFQMRHRLQPALAIMGVNAAVWLLATIVATVAGLHEADSSGIVSMLAMPAQPEAFMSRPWTLLTYMWLHPTFIHLAVNMIWLWWFWELLSEYSVRRLLTIYIGGGLAGGLSFLLTSAFMTAPSGELCGASGCVLALMGATAVAYPRRRIRFLFSSDVRLLWITLGAIVLTFLGGGGVLAGAAHAGGLAAGCLIMVSIKYSGSKNVKDNRQPTSRQARSFARKASKAMATHRLRVNPAPAHPAPSSESNAADSESRLQRRLDALLDKISVSGYDSLSGAERIELNEISSRIGSRD